MTNYSLKNDTINYTVDVFSETIAVKIEQLRKYVKKNTNSSLTGLYIEELVRGFIKQWIGHRLLLHGTFFTTEFSESEKKPKQIDGIVYDPTVGPTILKEGQFVIIHPAFCSGVIEIKMSLNKSLDDFENHLKEIHKLYMNHQSRYNVMGVVITDSNPEKKSKHFKNDNSENPSPIYTFNRPASCPIFILFKEYDDTYEPYKPAIDSMIRAIYNNFNKIIYK
ncbi:hypothetical protein JXQ31_14110, partial [candidate division KSB1 bacterium]|nr:hypothetical protein [candidate division KSB1 bacterium]